MTYESIKEYITEEIGWLTRGGWYSSKNAYLRAHRTIEREGGHIHRNEKKHCNRRQVCIPACEDGD